MSRDRDSSSPISREGIFATAFFKLKHSANNVFFLNLSLMYTVVALLVHPFSIYLIAVQNLTEPSSTVPMVTCQITGVIFETSIYLSLFSLTSVSLDRFVIVFFPLKYKCFVTVKKVYVWITICWIAVFILVIPVAVNHGVNSSDFVVYSTDNSTTVCQGRYWFLESGSDSEGMSYFERHVFVHVVAIIYLILCALSLAPNLAVIVRLNQSMYRTIQRTVSKSTSQLSTQDTTFSNSYLEEKDETPADLISPLRCSDMMKLTGKADILQSNLVIIPSTAEFKSSFEKKVPSYCQKQHKKGLDGQHVHNTKPAGSQEDSSSKAQEETTEINSDNSHHHVFGKTITNNTYSKFYLL
ncbi:neuropeptide FF receptor 2-like [Bolinopsis microptera]|uniref:neuropeptide FF receptor 2-like n=1 Tax=Bolinopsis microptera TaxID=2820187 RepID=UPI00307AB34C